MPKVRKTTLNKSEVWCVARRKWVAYTPEEEVRQWFLEVLSKNGVELFRVAVEQSVLVERRRLRVDIIVYDEAMKPEILVECKAPSVPIDDTVFAQANNYNSILGVKQIIVTNGKVTLTKIL